MRYLKLASNENPETDFIELNDFNGFLCTSFQPVGISRKLEFLAIKNRQFAVENKTSFKKYNLTIEILSKYSEYEEKHRRLITFLDRNKKDGLRLYFKPYEGMEERYCLCEIESSIRSEKRQPVILNLIQCSLWFGIEKSATTGYIIEESENLFAFIDNDGYYSASFKFDESINEYCIEFFNGVSSEAIIENNGYNEIPLKIKIKGKCVNPKLYLYKEGIVDAIQKTQIIADVNENHFIEINSNILENGVWFVDKRTGAKIDYSERVNNEMGSPYFFIEHGKYKLRVEDDANNYCDTEIVYKEEHIE